MESEENINENLDLVPDKQLLDVIRTGEVQKAVAEIFKRYMHLVYGVCMKYLDDKDESQDAVMDIFEDLLMNVKKHPIENLKSWLYTVTRNYCLMELRHRKVEAKYQESETLLRRTKELQNIQVFEENIEERYLHSAMLDLNPEQRECLKLFYFQEMSYKDISDTTGLSVKNVKSFIQNGKRNLRLKLANLRIL